MGLRVTKALKVIHKATEQVSNNENASARGARVNIEMGLSPENQIKAFVVRKQSLSNVWKAFGSLKLKSLISINEARWTLEYTINNNCIYQRVKIKIVELMSVSFPPEPLW